jgi:hypothetical protein
MLATADFLSLLRDLAGGLRCGALGAKCGRNAGISRRQWPRGTSEAEEGKHALGAGTERAKGRVEDPMKIRVSMIFAAGMLVVACSSTTNPATNPTGTGAQKLAVGSPCGQDGDCGSAPFFCMQGDHTGGYCMAKCNHANGDADCPSEAICQFDGTAGECHKKCDMQSDCRTGYTCAPASSTSTSMASHSFCDVAGGMGMGGDGGMSMDGGMMMDGM